MEIRILELKLRNFKGIKDFTLSPEGRNVNIYGDNATGKTTLMDAFIWLLFDKDSKNSSDFNIKTLDKDGNVIHGLEHEVSAKLDINGKVVELQKIYKEKWTKKREEAERTLTGHTTDYFINGVPKKKSEYDDYLNHIIDEETFKILTNPLYFNMQLDWRKRRDLALKICGEANPEEVFNRNRKLLELKPLLMDKSIDELKAEMIARRRKLNEELKSIPYRIDELTREKFEFDIEALTAEKKALEDKLIELKNTKGIDYDFRLRAIAGGIKALESEVKELELNITKEIREQLNLANESLADIKKSLSDAIIKMNETKHAVDITKREKERKEKLINELKQEFYKVASSEFSNDSTICPTCKQPLPIDEVDKLKKEFDNKKEQRLYEINELGKSHKRDLEELISQLDILQKEYSEAEKEVSWLKELLQNKEDEIKTLEEELKSIDITRLPKYKEIQEKLMKLYKEKEEVENLKNAQDNSKEIQDIESRIATINKKIARAELAKENEERVEELKARERELAEMVAETEKVEYLCNQYIITKAELLESRLNSKFRTVKFKLFDIQINGALNETFVATVNGVPFNDLNDAAKINAGLDIINTLNDYYGCIAPIFIDNRESVNEIVDVKSQVINLIVSKDKELRVEVL